MSELFRLPFRSIPSTIETMVRISVGSPTHHTSGRLYGVFFEDINHGADGGLKDVYKRQVEGRGI